MTNEPLKDKAKVMPKGTKLQLPHKEAKMAKCHIYYFKEEDVKSAVEWLKREVVMCRDDDERTKYDIDKILELINEAFPDLRPSGK